MSDCFRPAYGWVAFVVGVLSAGFAGGCGTNAVEGIGTVPPPGGSSPTSVPSFDGGRTSFGSAGDTDGGFAVSCDQDGGLITPPSPPGLMNRLGPVLGDAVQAKSPPPPISGGTLLVLRDGVTAVAADPDRDRVYVIDLSDPSSPTRRATIALPLRDEPGRLVEDGSGLVHVVLRNAGSVATLDPAKGQLTLRRAVCSAPRGIAYEAATNRIHVACAGGELVTFSATGTAVVRTLRLPQDLRDVIVDGSTLMVSRFNAADVIVVDGDGKVKETLAPPTFSNGSAHAGAQFQPSVAWRMVAAPDGGAMMVHQRGMRDTIGKTAGGYGGRNPCDSIVHTAVTRMKSGDRPLAGPALASFVLPVDLAVSPDGKKVAVVAAGNGHSTGLRKLFIANASDVTDEFIGGCSSDGSHGPAPPGVCTQSALDTTCAPGFLSCSHQCFDAFQGCPAGTALDLPNAMGNGVDGGVASSRDAGVNAAPSQDGGGKLVPCSPDIPGNEEPVAVAFAGPDRVLVQTRDPANLWIVSAGNVSSISLSAEGRADTGHTVFHANSGGGIACASCHPEGHEDGLVWNFQCEGARRTQDLGGGIVGTEPFHWNGDLATFPKLMDTVFVGRMSGPTLTSDQAGAALRWIDSIPSRTPLRLATDAAAQRGKLIFDTPTVGCASCHGGAAFTNNQTVEVGTTAAFQVPSLRGVAWRAPFMHDGCAPTLLRRFAPGTCGGGDAHGKTSQLTVAETNDLIAYLESL